VDHVVVRSHAGVPQLETSGPKVAGGEQQQHGTADNLVAAKSVQSMSAVSANTEIP
jgi:hypothetical protein